MKVLLVDDHPIMRLGVRQLIERAWGVAEIDEAETIADAIRKFGLRPAELVILDLSLPDTTGTEGVAYRRFRLLPSAACGIAPALRPRRAA